MTPGLFLLRELEALQPRNFEGQDVQRTLGNLQNNLGHTSKSLLAMSRNLLDVENPQVVRMVNLYMSMSMSVFFNGKQVFLRKCQTRPPRG